MAEFNDKENEELKFQLFSMKLNAFIGKRRNDGTKAEKIKEELRDYLAEMKIDSVSD